MPPSLSIGQIARATGVAAKTIRYYEQVGVLPAAGRTASGYRRYDQAGVERIHFIRRARSLGLPLEQLKTLSSALDGGSRLRPRLLALVREQLADVRHRIAELEVVGRQLEAVSIRMAKAARRRRNGACRCLEIERTAPRRTP